MAQPALSSCRPSKRSWKTPYTWWCKPLSNRKKAQKHKNLSSSLLCCLCLFVAISYLLCGAGGIPLKAARNLIRIECVAFHQHLDQTPNRILLRSHDRTGTLELFIDQLSRTLFDLVEQALAALLIRLAQVDWPEPAHAKLAHHRPCDLNRTLDVV